jgi:adenosylhomocysteine nucleosidase
MRQQHLIPVLIASDAEWRAAKRYYAPSDIRRHPFDSFVCRIRCAGFIQPVIFIRTGCGKVAAAAAAQYAIGLCGRALLMNIGTCGGFHGISKLGDVLVVRMACAYDVHEGTGRYEKDILKHRVRIPISHFPKPWPGDARAGNIATADQDLDPILIPVLREKPVDACAADWESAAVAWVARKNGARCLIIRGVSDVVSREHSTEVAILRGTKKVMGRLFDVLPEWLRIARLGVYKQPPC